MKIQSCDTAIMKHKNIEKNNISINFFVQKKKLFIIYIKNNNIITININNDVYNLYLKSEYFILCNMCNSDNDYININIRRFCEMNISETDNIIDNIYIYEYENPPDVLFNNKYQIVYSFDSNYFSGAFASIYSLLFNFNKKKLDNLMINIIIPQEDIEILQKKLLIFKEKIKNINQNYKFFIINKSVVDPNIMGTKCYKGGNHLLKLSNYARLIIGNLMNPDKLLYLDSDTIIQSDISLSLDKINDDNFVILGKKSELNFKNLFNSNNIHYANNYLCQNFDINRNVIFTGTLIINPSKFKQYFHKIIDLVKIHNSLENKGGLYKLFTMSIINISMYDVFGYMDDYISNVVDLGYKQNLCEQIKTADVLDWSGIYKPWFINGLYREYWKKYNIMYNNDKYVDKNKNTVEIF